MTIYLTGVFPALAALLGAMVGSFLNVCIYRLPLDMSVRSPARSFCPACRRQIPWFQNIPVLSWILLRGRCSGCNAPIPARYLVVEILNAVLFAAIALRVAHSNPWLLIPYGTLVSLLVVATFVDLEHMIIPDEVTWGGVAAGCVASLVFPDLHGAAGWGGGLLTALLGAAVGYGGLWTVVEVGRLVFGRRRLVFDPPASVTWVRTGETASLTVDGEELEWASLFPRGTEKVVMEVLAGEVDGKPQRDPKWEWRFESLGTAEGSLDLNQVNTVSAKVNILILPREVMGFGDVKFLAAIGAFTGWKAVLFTVMAASTAGALLGTAAFFLGKREWSSKIPFGPYLAFGAVLWIFAGPELLSAYWSLFAAQTK